MRAINKNADKLSTAVLLLNIGSPDSPRLFDVARYLSLFLGDKRVVPLPYFLRKILVNYAIVPFRCFRSSERYRKLWNHYGGKFPLPHFASVVQSKLKENLKNQADVFLGMCYGNPTIENQVKTMIENGYSKVILFPLFPQYASSSAGMALELALNSLMQNPVIPEIHTIGAFYNHPLFIKAFTEKVRMTDYKKYDHILFTYHSLPLSHIREVAGTSFDYEKACHCTTELIAKELGLLDNQFEMAFQSRMSGQWLGPPADEVIIRKAKEGVKSLLVVAPSFVADCLETTIELGEEYEQLFLKNGGADYRLVESLNDDPLWIDCIESIVDLSHES